MSIALIDANSIGYSSNSTAKLSVGEVETQAVYGVLNSVRELIVKFGYKPIMIWDGHAQWRYDLYPEYKANREAKADKELKPYEIAAQENRASYKRQVPNIIRGLSLLGVQQIIPKGDEADDVAAYLANHYAAKEIAVMLVSRDHDWLQNVNNYVSWYNPVEKHVVTRKTFQEVTGYKHPFQFVAEKCLLGDTSDNITGVNGVGKACAPLLINHYGSVKAFLSEVKLDSAEWKAPTPELKRYRKKLIEFGLNINGGIDIYDRNWKLMNLLNVEKPKNLKIIKDPLDEAAFKSFCQELAFHSIIKKQQEWLSPFVR